MSVFKASVKNGKPCEKVLKIEVDPSEVKKEFETFYSEISPKAKVPGFRPGKAPRQVLAMHYKEEAYKHVLNELIGTTYAHAVKEKELEPIGYPEVDEVDFSEEKLNYRASVEVRPEIKLSKVTGLCAKKESAEVKPEEIEESLKRIQKSHAEYKTIEDRPAQKNDYVVIDYVCKSGDVEVDKRQDDWLQIKEEEYLKGFSVQLEGVKAGDEKEVKVTLPENFWRKEYAGKEAVFSVKVKELKQELLPELSDDLAKSAGEFDTFDALKEKITTEIKTNKETKVEAAYEKALLDELLKHNKINLPERLVAKRLDRLVHESIHQYERYGFPKEKIEELTQGLRKDLEEEAKNQVHLAFLLDEISEKEKLAATEEDIENRYKEVAAQVRQDVEVVRKYYSENEEAKQSLLEQIRSQKAVQFIKNNAKQK